ncbi:hypothetical protein [Streptosporangium sp. NBC_01756]|uniref:hypothetical protein n=1 Tax=Streptosporangium sp. NBC_01756 TaxID=2975950 RepID=UPI002DD81F90|nr:hypothetical protein [Streptosporangium sp. NBC_01756]WSC83549.1 hypothetical protein OIE48_24435 [Streptosporangium sp. NBC_01756]
MDHSAPTPLQTGSQAAISDRMRELLARATRDQVSGQDTQDTALNEIRQRLEGMEWLLREVREREPGGLGGSPESGHGRLDDGTVHPPTWAEGLAQHVEAVRDRVDAMGERVGSVHDRVTPLGELPSLWADVGAVGENVDEVLVRLQSISDGTRDVGDGLGELAERLGRIQAGMEAAATRFTRLDRTLADLTQRAERLESGMLDLSTTVRKTVSDATDRLLAAVEQVNGRVSLLVSRTDGRADGVEVRIDGLDGRLGGIDGHLAALDERMSGVGPRLREITDRHDDRFDTLDERLYDVEGRIAGRVDAVDSRLSMLDGHTEKLGLRLEDLDDRVEAVDQRVGRLPAILNIREIIGDQAGDHARRFDSLDERVTHAQAALAHLAGMLRAQPDREQLTEALSETMEPARAELSRSLSALEETMLTLAEALLRPARGDKD